MARERTYEAIVTLMGTADVEQVDKVFAKHGASVLQKDDWGRRSLAYPIKKQAEGHAVLYKIKAPAACIKDIRHSFQLMESILRSFITVVTTEKQQQAATTARPAA